MKEEIQHLVNKAAEDAGYMVYSSAVILRGENSRIIVKIDSFDGISHDDCEHYSRVLDEKLTSAALLPNFSLEISSPGLDRELRSIDEYIRFVKAPVKVKHHSDKGVVVTMGKLKGVDEDSLTIDTERKEVAISIDSIVMVNLDY